jgi:hypothetical protein
MWQVFSSSKDTDSGAGFQNFVGHQKPILPRYRMDTETRHPPMVVEEPKSLAQIVVPVHLEEVRESNARFHLSFFPSILS